MRDLLLTIDPALGRRAGLERALRDAVRSGRLGAGSLLPSSRSLAGDLGYSRSTVVAVYEQLTSEGYLESVQGTGTIVAAVRTPESETPAPTPNLVRYRADFRPGEPDTSTFPRQRWLRSVRQVLADAPDEAFGYPDPRGCRELRDALANYLARSRSVVVTPDAISVFAGFAAAVGFLGELFVKLGIDKVAIEDPTLFVVRDILQVVGVTPIPVPVDEQGIDLDALEASGARAVFTTPAHQYPLGVTMSPQRRTALIEWAVRHDAWIVEDDYDGEFRYERRPLGSLQGLDPGRVIYAGTASKSLIPGLRQAWLVVPSALRRDLGSVKHIRGATSVLDQLALAEFIRRGELDRHLRSVRKIYGDRERALLEALRAEVGWPGISTQPAGLHMAVPLPPHLDERKIVREAAEEGIGLMPLGPHYMKQSSRRGLVLGYSRPAGHEFPQALTQLVGFLRTAS